MEHSENKVFTLNDAEKQIIAYPNLYQKAKAYWNGVSKNLQGVLNFTSIHEPDITRSIQILNQFKEHPMNRALDVGAGIGRVSQHLLSKYYKTIDLLEPETELLKTALENKELAKYIGKSYNVGFQDITFEYSYDCIWIQWVLSQLPFDTCIKVLAESKKHLTPDGIIVVKENIIDSEYEAEFDELDASLIRDDGTILEIVKRAGLKIVLNERQGNFPKEISDLIILVLQ